MTNSKMSGTAADQSPETNWRTTSYEDPKLGMLDLKLLVKDSPRVHKQLKTQLPFTLSWAHFFYNSSTLLVKLTRPLL